MAGCRLLAVVVAVSQGAAVAVLSAAGSVMFDGLPHTSLGGALLRPDPARETLEVLPFDPDGGDGVKIALPEAKSWSARLSAAGSDGAPLSVDLDAIADGRRISTLAMRQNGSQFGLSAAFTGGIRPTYSVHVYTNGRLVGSMGGVQPGNGGLLVPAEWCELFPDIFSCGLTADFHNSANSECEWRLVFGTSMPITLPNGVVVTGNELRLVEEVNPAGHYPYLTFDAIAIRSNTRLLTLFSETVQ
jgi:hypothetical protein